MLIKNVKIMGSDRIFDGAVLVENGKIEEVFDGFSPVLNCETVDGGGLYLSSGFIDLHVHGGNGKSAMGTADDIVKMCDAHRKYGTTSILPTALSSPIAVLEKSVDEVKAAQKKCKSNILGIHLEGPFLSPVMCGAQKTDSMLTPATADYLPLIDRWSGIKMMGVAPELDGATELGNRLIERGIVASVAHSNASFEIALDALNGSFSDVTHIYCACSANHKEGAFRFAGVVEAGLYSDCTVQVIADLKHLPVGILKLIYKCKGKEKMYLITDALEFAACETKDGETVTQANGIKAKVVDGVMMTEDLSRIAGSKATMNALVRNMYKTVGVPLYEAVYMASATPAKVIGLENTKGKIEKGFDADLVLFDDDINISSVFVNGKRA